MPDLIPLLTDYVPPWIHGTACLARRAFAGHALPELLAFAKRPIASPENHAALILDWSIAHELSFRLAEAEALRAMALAQCQVFRVASNRRPNLRVLALLAPGDVGANTPLDFLTGQIDVQLDLLFVIPSRPLPAELPDHDVAFFAAGESEPETLDRLTPLFAAWPRPVVNDPAKIGQHAREILAAGLARIPGLCTAPTRRATRETLLTQAAKVGLPSLVRPAGSHGGAGLRRFDRLAELVEHVAGCPAGEYVVTRFVDYAAHGLYRKYRVAFIGGRPFLCHLAVSDQWMVHYVHAGMADSAAARADEEAAMAEFDHGFAARHQAALAAVAGWAGIDYFQIDCAQAADGRLLVFEADVAAIVHDLDPPSVFPYKRAQMHKIFAAFGHMLESKAGRNEIIPPTLPSDPWMGKRLERAIYVDAD